MTFAEIFEALYGDGTANVGLPVDEASLMKQARARNEIVHLSDAEWNDWIEYRESRKAN